MQAWVRTLIAIVLALTSLSAMSEREREQVVTDTEIRIGNVMPYSGSLEVFGAIGKAEAAYFEMINERGGINGRKVRFISYDDKSDPSTALDLTRGRIDLKAIRSRDFCICRSACRRSESNPNSGGSQLASCVHIEPYGFIDCDGAKACRLGKRLGRNYSRLLEGCK